MVNLIPLCLPLLAYLLQGPGWEHVSAQQSDPCVDYTELNDPWRSTSNTDQSQARCDQDIVLQGWYLLVDGNASVLMPNSCVPRYRCSTHAPLWLNGAHPTPAEGVVSRQVCGHWVGGCCDFSHSIQVKACPGGYTVYQLVHPTHCDLAYCADLSSRGTLPTQTPAPTTASKQRCGVASEGISFGAK
ncbi:pancreatic secretory granule membrane major glycoprotein GP2-like isoform X2 [Engraulis encrasicolus]|uniref:pancreatic secretory granule membrane major glycoprotein GP2-like isoform X2 n=1 Tax=Engraulis encrasicolus TaxID=184585 RepID=UPI002FCFB9D2